MRFANITILIALSAVMPGVSTNLHAAEDLCAGAIDPYDMAAEKTRFYTAAGKDNELSATEFAAIKIGPIGFRHKFDKWSEMLKFDSDGNKSLDWLEAGAYRLAMRKKVLDAFDANLDGKLTGSERESASKTLAMGKIRFDAKPKPTGPDPRLAEAEKKIQSSHKSRHGSSHRRPHERPDPSSHKRSDVAKKHAKPPKPPKPVLSEKEQAERDQRAKRKAEFMEKYDTNRDGKISSEEKNAYIRELKARRDKERAARKKNSGKPKPPKPYKKGRREDK